MCSVDRKERKFKLEIFRLGLDVNLGWSEEERSVKQRVEIDLALTLNSVKAAESDLLDDTVDYVKVAAAIEKMATECEWRLIEKMSGDLASELLESFSLISELKITIFKKVKELKVKEVAASLKVKRG